VASPASTSHQRRFETEQLKQEFIMLSTTRRTAIFVTTGCVVAFFAACATPSEVVERDSLQEVSSHLISFAPKGKEIPITLTFSTDVEIDKSNISCPYAFANVIVVAQNNVSNEAGVTVELDGFRRCDLATTTTSLINRAWMSKNANTIKTDPFLYLLDLQVQDVGPFAPPADVEAGFLEQGTTFCSEGGAVEIALKKSHILAFATLPSSRDLSSVTALLTDGAKNVCVMRTSTATPVDATAQALPFSDDPADNDKSPITPSENKAADGNSTAVESIDQGMNFAEQNTKGEAGASIDTEYGLAFTSEQSASCPMSTATLYNISGTVDTVDFTFHIDDTQRCDMQKTNATILSETWAIAYLMLAASSPVQRLMSKVNETGRSFAGVLEAGTTMCFISTRSPAYVVEKDTLIAMSLPEDVLSAAGALAVSALITDGTPDMLCHLRLSSMIDQSTGKQQSLPTKLPATAGTFLPVSTCSFSVAVVSIESDFSSGTEYASRVQVDTWTPCLMGSGQSLVPLNFSLSDSSVTDLLIGKANNKFLTGKLAEKSTDSIFRGLVYPAGTKMCAVGLDGEIDSSTIVFEVSPYNTLAVVLETKSDGMEKIFVVEGTSVDERVWRSCEMKPARDFTDMSTVQEAVLDFTYALYSAKTECKYATATIVALSSEEVQKSVIVADLGGLSRCNLATPETFMPFDITATNATSYVGVAAYAALTDVMIATENMEVGALAHVAAFPAGTNLCPAVDKEDTSMYTVGSADVISVVLVSSADGMKQKLLIAEGAWASVPDRSDVPPATICALDRVSRFMSVTPGAYNPSATDEPTSPDEEDYEIDTPSSAYKPSATDEPTGSDEVDPEIDTLSSAYKPSATDEPTGSDEVDPEIDTPSEQPLSAPAQTQGGNTSGPPQTRNVVEVTTNTVISIGIPIGNMSSNVTTPTIPDGNDLTYITLNLFSLVREPVGSVAIPPASLQNMVSVTVDDVLRVAVPATDSADAVTVDITVRALAPAVSAQLAVKIPVAVP
jgi:hypothetical protein